MLNSIEPPWYVTRMPGGVTGKACEGLPMSIFEWQSSPQSEIKNQGLVDDVDNQHMSFWVSIAG